MKSNDYYFLLLNISFQACKFRERSNVIPYFFNRELDPVGAFYPNEINNHQS